MTPDSILDPIFEGCFRVAILLLKLSLYPLTRSSSPALPQQLLFPVGNSAHTTIYLASPDWMLLVFSLPFNSSSSMSSFSSYILICHLLISSLLSPLSQPSPASLKHHRTFLPDLPESPFLILQQGGLPVIRKKIISPSSLKLH